jgi:hypothetical protein
LWQEATAIARLAVVLQFVVEQVTQQAAQLQQSAEVTQIQPVQRVQLYAEAVKILPMVTTLLLGEEDAGQPDQ